MDVIDPRGSFVLDKILMVITGIVQPPAAPK
jgi:hypothetical protein